MKRRDYCILIAYSWMLFGIALVSGRSLTMHESVLPQCTREMYESGNWLVPTSGDRPWLHRPPLPHWVLLAIATVAGRCDAEWVVRLGPTLMSTFTVLLLAWMAQRWYGGSIGLLSGLILATSFQFTRYAWLAEEDSILCAVITGVMALFVKLEFAEETTSEKQPWWKMFLGWRSWTLLGFFILFGLTNMAKGLVFGPVMAGVPLVAYLLWNRRWNWFGKLSWLWGWIALAIAGGLWPWLMYQTHPDVVEMWLFDYAGRLNQGYVGEPWWYYLATMPWALLPWTPFALIGAWIVTKRLGKSDTRPERFLWCWAIVTVVFFSIPDGKHHHYIIHCLPPWGILSAVGIVRFRLMIQNWQGKFNHPVVPVLTFGLPAIIALWFVRHKIPGPTWTLPALMAAVPVVILFITWVLRERRALRSAMAGFAALMALYWGIHLYAARYGDQGITDHAFLREVPKHVDRTEPLYVNAQLQCCLEVNRVLFYMDKDTRVVHNLTFLLDERIKDRKVQIITRACDEPVLHKLGEVRLLLQSEKSRRELSPGDRLTLYELTFKPDLPRYPNQVTIQQQQIKMRVAGPFLGGKDPQTW
jgi:4-amino-4-deoxy-L-arabinose transferase-like glycosyltransferase